LTPGTVGQILTRMSEELPPLDAVPELKPGHYCDGHPLGEVHYLECKADSADLASRGITPEQRP
jgi:hypothetical protein